MARKKVLVVGSNRQDGSVTNGPCWPVVRLIAGGYPKNGLSPTTPVCAEPSAPNTWMASLTASTTCPLPVHSPWSGGSRLNWLPPLVSRCCRWLMPSKLCITRGPLRTTLFGAAALVTEPAAARFAPFAPCVRLWLRLVPVALLPRAVAAAAASSPSCASGPNALGISLDMAAGSPVPFGDGLYEPVPAFWIWRVVTDGAAGAADALMLPANGSMPTPMTSAATADSFLRLCSDIPRSLSSRRRVLRGSRRPGSPPARVRGLRMTLDQVRRRGKRKIPGGSLLISR